MREAVARVEALAAARQPVVVVGEHGTGRHRLARRLHDHASGRRCVALEAEHPAFGEARSAREFLESALDTRGCGTLVIRRIDKLQPELLSALRSRLRGDRGPRLVLTSAVELEQTPLRDHGRWYDTIELPPLRCRTADIPDLVAEFVAAEAEALEVEPPAMGPGVLDAIENHPWPGNLTELRSVLHRALVATRGRSPIEVGDLPVALRRAAREAEGATLVPIERLVRFAILDAHRRLGGRRAEMARALGLSPRTLSRKLRAYGIGRGDAT